MSVSIKYRGVRTDNWERVFGTSLISRRDWSPTNGWKQRYYLLDGDSCNQIPDLDKFVEIEPDSLGRFIGLKDRHDTEIYEGDLVILLDYPWCKNKEPQIVEYDEVSRGFEPFSNYIEEFGWPHAGQWCEVVGDAFIGPA